MRAAMKTSVFAWVACAAAVGASAAELGHRPNRLMPFLCRDAVVRESPDTAVLAGKGVEPAPVIVRGHAPAGPWQKFGESQLAEAAGHLQEFVRKITGVTYPVIAGVARKAILRGSFEAPPQKEAKGSGRRYLSEAWYAHLNRAPNAVVELDQAITHSGRASLTARGPTELTGCAGGVVSLNITQGRSYRLTFWYRTNDGPGFAYLAIPHLRKPVREYLPKSLEWKRYETTYRADNPKGNYLVIILGLARSKSETTQVWFDDVLLEEDATEPASARRIFVGTEAGAAEAFPELEHVDAQGFLIATRDRDLHIASRTTTGVLYGVWFFLMNYAGVRIVMPGELGEVYPTLDAIRAPRDLYVLNPGPDFLLRTWSQEDFDHTGWLKDYWRTRRFEFHHNMYRIFPPARFGKSNPEFYPVVCGRRAIPTKDAISRWNPTFSEPAVAKRAMEYADEVFTNLPHLRSISLSVNDGGGYSELDFDAANATAATFGDIYYGFVNKVARHVRQRWPDRYVVLFPYSSFEQPPASKMEDNVIIMLLNEAQRDMPAWEGKAKQFGVYQWLYGKWWVFPNHWPHAMREYLIWLRSKRARLFKGEVYGTWAHDGAKQWVLANLLWNTDLDVDALLADYYEHMYGKEAATPMARYYAQAEQVYERRRRPNEYRFFTVLNRKAAPYVNGPDQFLHVTDEDMRIMAEALSDAHEAVRGEANRRRFEITRDAYELCRYYREECKLARGLGEGKIASVADVREFVNDATALARRVQARLAFCRTRIDPSWTQYAACYFGSVKRGGDRPKEGVDWDKIDHGFRLNWRKDIREKLARRVMECVQRTLASQAKPSRAAMEEAVDALLPQSRDPMIVHARKIAGRFYFAPRVTEPPVIDGRLADPAWKQTESAGDFLMHKRGTPAEHPTEFRVCYDHGHLYVGIKAHQDASTLYVYTQRHDAPVWREDSVEFVIHPSESPDADFYHLIVNPKGNVYDQLKEHPGFTTKARIKTGVEPKCFVIEAAIPRWELEPLGISPSKRFARLNVMRNFRSKARAYDNPLHSAWYFVTTGNLDPNARGWLCFVP